MKMSTFPVEINFFGEDRELSRMAIELEGTRVPYFQYLIIQYLIFTVEEVESYSSLGQHNKTEFAAPSETDQSSPGS